MTGKRKRKLAMPDTLIIVASVVLLVAILSWIIPSGTYDYQEMNINGRIRNVAIDGTYHTIDKSEVTTTGFLGFFSVLYRGCVEAADVIFMILCCCGTFGVVVKTGAFHAGIGTILNYMLSVGGFLPGAGTAFSIAGLFTQILNDLGIKEKKTIARIENGTASEKDKIFLLDKVNRVAHLERSSF